ncbi:MAG: hypothetical protein LBR81_01050 [Prevotellaceae bacterium]|jgi:hypothetical protein|nr:hypothetical protein [Prevotellaceae bacterium]
MKQILLIFLTVLCIGSASSLYAQVDTKGTDFWLSFGTNVEASYLSVMLQIRIAADAPVNGTITYTESGQVVPFSIATGGTYTHQLTDNEKKIAYTSGGTAINNKSIRIQSDVPVSVYALNTYANLADATIVLPTSLLGNDYYHLGRLGTTLSQRYRDQYIVIATKDNTVIYENDIQVANLQKGQIYFKQASYTTDMSGYHITSNNPVAYFSAHNYCVIDGGGDNLFQQLTPVDTWGKQFLVPITNRGVELIRIVASQDGTVIEQTGGTIMTVQGGKNTLNLNAGEWVELKGTLINKGCYIRANKPIQVCSYMVGQQYVGATNIYEGADEALTWIPPIEQSVKSALITPFAVSYLKNHFALIVTPTATKNKTTLSIGGAFPSSLSGGQWYDNPESGMSFYNIELTNTSLSYLFANPEGLIVYAYGFGSYISYYYLASSSMRILSPAFYANDIHFQDLASEVICSQEPVVFRAEIAGDLSTSAGHLKWYINGIEEVSARDKFTWSKPLANGSYQIKMEALMSDNVNTKTAEGTLTIECAESQAPPCETCSSCPSDFAPIPGKEYVFSGWVKDDGALKAGAYTYENGCSVTLTYELSNLTERSDTLYPSGAIIDGWQRIQQAFTIPADACRISIKLNNNSNSDDVFFDDIRVHPFNAGMKSFVYDPVTLRLSAELDDNNYATFYEYDEEGALVRVKKETERGVMTIREARQGQQKIGIINK